MRYTFARYLSSCACDSTTIELWAAWKGVQDMTDSSSVAYACKCKSAALVGVLDDEEDLRTAAEIMVVSIYIAELTLQNGN